MQGFQQIIWSIVISLTFFSFACSILSSSLWKKLVSINQKIEYSIPSSKNMKINNLSSTNDCNSIRQKIFKNDEKKKKKHLWGYGIKK